MQELNELAVEKKNLLHAFSVDGKMQLGAFMAVIRDLVVKRPFTLCVKVFVIECGPLIFGLWIDGIQDGLPEHGVLPIAPRAAHLSCLIADLDVQRFGAVVVGLVTAPTRAFGVMLHRVLLCHGVT